jgi:hydrogenase-4 component B
MTPPPVLAASAAGELPGAVALVLAAIVLLAVSGVPGLFPRRTAAAGQWLAAALAVAGGALGIAGALGAAASAETPELALPWPVPGGEFAVAVDGLSAVFLLPVFLVAALGSVYGLGYWKQAEHPDNGRKLRLCYGLLAAGMALVVVARNAVLFLAAWEVMAVAAYFLVTTEDDQAEARAAGWVYLVATHTATLCLFALFALLRHVSGSFALAPLDAAALTPGTATALFMLALLGFGAKAGLVPLHVWLPGAHASAPSHVSAILSGVLLKVGVYGLVRVTSLVPAPPPWWGGLLLALGTVSGILGVAYALGQHDLKRLLAYHSIENIGIIVMGLGLALLGRSLGQRDWLVLGMGAALLHVWNHALFKSLLFLSAGSVVHATHTRDLDRLGGLARPMPWTALAFLVGAVAICGLPPLNGLVSELLLYLGLFRTLGAGDSPAWATAALAAPALALIGALALACFVKAYGAAFLGLPRSPDTKGAHESGPLMLAPLAVLAGLCFLIGLAPALVAPLLQQGIAAWAPAEAAGAPGLADLAPLGWVSAVGGLLAAFLAGGAAVLAWRLRQGGVASGPTWDCGYAAPSPRMQYTASSFAERLVGLLAGVLRPRVEAPRDLPLFPREAHFHSEVPDAVLEEAVLPAFRGAAWLLAGVRFLQRGGIQVYLLYVFACLLALLLWR